MVLSLLESRLTYKPTQNNYGALDSALFTEAFITDAEKNKIHVAYKTKDSSLVVIFMHGRDGNLTKFGRHYAVLDELGLSYVTFDYPGYGRSTGTPTERSLYASARAVTDFAKRIFKVESNRLVYCGLSLGGAVAIELAVTEPPYGVAVESTFTCSRDMGKVVLPWIPLHRLVSNKYASIDKVSAIRSPIVFVHGTEDRRVPYRHSEVLLRAGGGPRSLVTVPGAGHLDLVDKIRELYPEILRSLIADRLVRLPSGTETATVINLS